MIPLDLSCVKEAINKPEVFYSKFFYTLLQTIYRDTRTINYFHTTPNWLRHKISTSAFSTLLDTVENVKPGVAMYPFVNDFTFAFFDYLTVEFPLLKLQTARERKIDNLLYFTEQFLHYSEIVHPNSTMFGAK